MKSGAPAASAQAGLRRRQPYDEPLPSTMRWTAALPAEIRPFALLRQYPRIANLIARSWHDRNECHRCFDDLLIDRRGNRTGFPLQVLEDLLTLRDYYSGRYPVSPPSDQPKEESVATRH